jgi:hypothetical protein
MLKEEIEALFQQDESALLHSLGELLVSGRGTSHFNPPSVIELVDTAKKYFSDVREQVRDTVCTNDKVRRYLETEKTLDNIQLALAVASALGGIKWLPAAQVSILAVMLVRRGLEAYCKVQRA